MFHSNKLFVPKMLAIGVIAFCSCGSHATAQERGKRFRRDVRNPRLMSGNNLNAKSPLPSHVAAASKPALVAGNAQKHYPATSPSFSVKTYPSGSIAIIGQSGEDQVVVSQSKMVFSNGVLVFIDDPRTKGIDFAQIVDPVSAIEVRLLGGNDRFAVRESGCTVRFFVDGGNGDDVIQGGPRNDSLTGGHGHDWIEAGDGDDLVMGGIGPDKFNLPGPSTDGDSLMGGNGNDTIYGEQGDDNIDGGPGYDQICQMGGTDNVVVDPKDTVK